MTPLGLIAIVLLGLALITALSRALLPRAHALWMPLYGASVGAAVMAGFAQPLGAAALAALFALGWATGRVEGWRRAVGTLGTATLALALALHLVPGFDNPRLLDGFRWRPEATPFTLYANFDKASAGLILLAFLVPRGRPAVRPALPATLLAAVATPAAVLAAAWAAGIVSPEAGWPGPPGQVHAAFVFLAINLLFTCVAEEAFFRGLLQGRLMHALPQHPAAQSAAIAVSALLFGAAHLGGGLGYAALAALAGLGYALVYAHTRSVESAIAVHFAVNAIHLLGFTYPRLA